MRDGQGTAGVQEGDCVSSLPGKGPMVENGKEGKGPKIKGSRAFGMHLYGHASMGSRQEVVCSVDQILQDAVGQVLLVQLVGHRQAGLRHHPACQQGQGLRLQRLWQHTYTLTLLKTYATVHTWRLCKSIHDGSLCNNIKVMFSKLYATVHTWRLCKSIYNGSLCNNVKVM